MRMRSLAIAAALLTFSSITSLAQTTGSMEGLAADESGGVLPGVTVEARSPAVQGARVATTDASGRYRLGVLPPGLYDVTFTLPGFATESKKAVSVGLGKETTLDAVLEHYERLAPDPKADERLRRPPLTRQERADLLAFLRSLSELPDHAPQRHPLSTLRPDRR